MSNTTTNANLGGRPKKAEAERRTQQRKIRLTVAEELHIEKAARNAGMTLSEFMRHRALSIPVTPPPQRVEASLLRELNSIGVNINQLARNSNSGRGNVEGINWKRIAKDLNKALEKVAEAF